MTLFVDTSGILALVDWDDPRQAAVLDAFRRTAGESLATHAYVIVETMAVARRRFGPGTTADLIDRVIPALAVAPVDAALHASALAAFRAAVDSSVSLVDRTSFEFMRREGLRRAIAVDDDFRSAGFETLP